jgi:putative peptidoglycan lipid II flippase
VFVNRLANAPRHEAAESISAVVTLAAAGLVVSTLLFELLAPEIIRAYTFGTAGASSIAEQHVAVDLLRFFAPQLLFYGAISLMAAVLATQDRFVAVGIVPVVNNVVSIGVLAAFIAIEHTISITAIERNSSVLLLLGLGTTAGVALQAVALVPSMRRSSLRLHFVWRPSDPAVRGILSLSGWTFGFVLANQIAVFVILAMEYHLGEDRVSAYTYAYAFFQFPFGVAATAIVNVATPDLARAWGAGDTALMGRRLGIALRQLLAMILPSMTAYLILARPAVTLILYHGQETLADAHRTAAVLVLFALGLPGYCIYFLAIRTFQAMRDTRTAFWCYLIENGINIALAVLLYHRLGIQGLALSYSIAYTVAAVVALVVIRHRLGTMGGRAIASSSLRSFAMAVVMAVVLALVVTLTGTSLGQANSRHSRRRRRILRWRRSCSYARRTQDRHDTWPTQPKGQIGADRCRNGQCMRPPLRVGSATRRHRRTARCPPRQHADRGGPGARARRVLAASGTDTRASRDFSTLTWRIRRGIPLVPGCRSRGGDLHHDLVGALRDL